MGCGCKSRKGSDQFKGLQIRETRWTKKLITETLYMYNELLSNSKKSLEDWGIIFHIHNKIFVNSTMTDTLNVKHRVNVTKNLRNFYKEFQIIKKNNE
tara:strand:- start:219 stop:512 length:294 start_codon:yes stop_codon:yes gene_type:complete